MTPRDAYNRVWDAVVIGTGIGGATAGYALAKAGMSVLFCEKGSSSLGQSDLLTGDWAEALYSAEERPGPLEDFMRRAGRSTERFEGSSAKGSQSFVPLLGEVTGGSSALYGMVMERFFPADFRPGSYLSSVAGTTAPAEWPISYDALEPYYRQAEALYGVRATRDPLRPAREGRDIEPAPAFSAPNDELVRFLEGKGLHPYHVPMACEYVDGCRECIGFICSKGCKHDSAKACLEPALDQFGAKLLDRCDVLRLESDFDRVTHIHCRRENEEFRLRAKQVILSAGALQTPAILLRSTSENWPDGLGNRSGLVGRNLMRHLLDYYIVQTKAQLKAHDLVKQVAFNDLYWSDGLKLGTVQSNGRLPPPAMVAAGYVDDLCRDLRLPPVLGRVLAPIVRMRIKQLLKKGIVLASLLEDYPYADNRVTLRPDGGLAVRYDLYEDDRTRLNIFRGKIARTLKPYRFTSIRSAERIRTLGHACGTCRFGRDPRSSVLDSHNRAHGIDNLYVVDSSFLPTSAGTNPSLTVAANALRVGDLIAQKHKAGAENALP